MRKLPAKYHSLAVGTTMAFVMTFLMTGIVTLLNEGPSPDYAVRWIELWARVLPISWPTVLIVGPLARRAVGALVERPGC